MFTNSLFSTVAIFTLGMLLQFSYSGVMIAVATIECFLAFLFRWMLVQESEPAKVTIPVRAESFTD